MRTEQTIEGIRARLLADRAVGKRVALVPTMGALHDGHLALVDAARAAADTVVVSVFVNPLQFGPEEDFARYPRTLPQDVAALEARGVTLLFAPLVEEMYRPGERTIVTPPPYADMYEGAVRPGHFAGVLTVVAKLFNIVRPDAAVFGRKDLQQLALIRGMQHELNFPVDIIPVETVRDADGLALSSRNRYLSSEDRVRARQLRAALRTAKSAHDAGTGASMDVAAAGRGALARDGAMDIDYFAVVRETDFSTPAVAGPGDAVIAAIRLGGTRLIDNILL